MKQFNYKGKIITASSKEEAIQKIVADSKKPNIDMKVVNKWMKKNLDLTDEGLGKDHWKKNGEVYYTWQAAKRIAKKVSGYHIPTLQEWCELAESCGCICENSRAKTEAKFYNKAQKLRTKLGIDFSGVYYPWEKRVDTRGETANFWTSESKDTKCAFFVYFVGPDMNFPWSKKSEGLSVRLVKD